MRRTQRTHRHPAAARNTFGDNTTPAVSTRLYGGQQARGMDYSKPENNPPRRERGPSRWSGKLLQRKLRLF